MSRITGPMLAACAWLALAATATAQVPAEPEDPNEKERPDIFLAAPDAVDLDHQLEQMIFGGQGAGKVGERMRAALGQQIARFDKEYGLNPAQKKKLEVAGRRDIKRYFDQVEEVKAEFRRVKGDWNQVSDRVFELQGMHSRAWELFGVESMLAKTLRANLTREQVAGRDKTKYRARVDWMTGVLHSRLVLRTDQRKRLVDLVVAETAPLRRYGDFDYDAIMFQMSRLPREKLRTVLDEDQCRELTLRFEQARRMESVLVSEGYLFPTESPAGAATGAPTSHREEARR